MSTLSATVTRTPYPDGKVVVPDDERYDSARQAWNLAVDQRPAAVVLPESAADVAAAVRCAASCRPRRSTPSSARPEAHVVALPNPAGPLILQVPALDEQCARELRIRGADMD